MASTTEHSGGGGVSNNRIRVGGAFTGAGWREGGRRSEVRRRVGQRGWQQPEENEEAEQRMVVVTVVIEPPQK
jgi:hypothetical protein